MKKSVIFVLLLAVIFTLSAGNYLFIFKKDKTVHTHAVTSTDSIKFTANQTVLNIHNSDLSTSQYNISDIDSLIFGNYDDDKVTIIYKGNSVQVVNPLVTAGIIVTVDGADVTVNANVNSAEVTYNLLGNTADGSFKIYSNYKYKLLLNNVTITNTNGPAINMQSSKKATIVLNTGTTNTLTDGTVYATSSEDQKATLFAEGQIVINGTGTLNISSKSAHAICSDDYVSVESGIINVTSATKDAIHANDYFKMTDGTLTLQPTSDGIDSEGYVDISGGTVNYTNSVADTKAMASDSIMMISGGTFNFTINGNQSKGLKSAQNMTLSGGNYTINTSGGIVSTASGSGLDIAYCTAIKSDSSVVIAGGSYTINATGVAGKGISVDKNFTMTNGTLNITTSGNGAAYTNSSGVKDGYSAAAITADENITITSGNITISCSGSGGKGISSNKDITIGSTTSSPTINVTTTGLKFLVNGTDYDHPKTMKSDNNVTINNGNITLTSSDDGIHAEKNYTQNGGSVTVTKSYEGIEGFSITLNSGSLTVTASNDGINATAGTTSGGTELNDGSSLNINGGTLITTCTNGDAIDSNGNVFMNGGLVIANGPSSGMEEGADFNGTFTMTGGTFIAAGSNSNMTKAMSTSSTQVNVLLKSSTLINSSTLLHIQNGSGTDILTFKPQNGGYYFLFSASALKKTETYSIYTGGSYTGGTNTNGYMTGGTYSTSGATLKKNTTFSSTVNTISI